MGDDEYSPRDYSLVDARHRRGLSVTSPGVAPAGDSMSMSTSPLHSPAYEPLGPYARGASATAPPEAYQPTSPHLPPHLGTPQGGYVPSVPMLPPSAYSARHCRPQLPPPPPPPQHHHHHRHGHRHGSHQPPPLGPQGSVPPPSSSPYPSARGLQPEYGPIAASATPVRPHRPPSRSYATPTTAYSHARTLADWELQQPHPSHPSQRHPLHQSAYDPLQAHFPQRTSPIYHSASTSPFDEDDPSTPLVYLCRPMTIKAFLALKPQFASHLELRFVASLKDLASDLRQASFLDPEIKRSKRLTIVSAVGGTDAFISRIKNQITQRLVWKEVRDKDQLVDALRVERGAVTRWKDRQEIEKGYQQIKATQEITTHLGVLVASSNGHNGNNDDGSEEDVKPDIRWLQEREDDDDEEEERALYGEQGEPTRKRRRESSGEEAELGRLPPLGPARLYHLCSQPRRRATERARAQGLLVDAFTQKVDSELQLGEWDHGEWTLFDESLDPIEPALQVLIARAIRDAAYPPHLRLYDYQTSREQLEYSVPWFTKLLRLIESRIEVLTANQRSPPSTSTTSPSDH
ncbi:BZ3500_MvSof-1268-A1-R1_Chr4-3g07416 [Microbotryum saponariae]|uniref:BZ3500_MvSof-1268-A1-R1_Chr4-3g07416 protein n=1 Tax=Microbotryum saponariae TaxID=289078 RepID=A0A2X0MZH2_9BASI|nr:BZ3500_MvSof-1268-A1-R1_Chr4-3g07416 [Microbotryum saponariae]SDA07079.1 BZ3501_MvSof-1269-A2-R1_Chr4-2g07125 [Microbotryum saponariae]